MGSEGQAEEAGQGDPQAPSRGPPAEPPPPCGSVGIRTCGCCDKGPAQSGPRTQGPRMQGRAGSRVSGLRRGGVRTSALSLRLCSLRRGLGLRLCSLRRGRRRTPHSHPAPHFPEHQGYMSRAQGGGAWSSDWPGGTTSPGLVGWPSAPRRDPGQSEQGWALQCGLSCSEGP